MAPRNEKEAQLALIDSVATSGLYTYHYSDYLCARLIKLCCSCRSGKLTKRLARLDRHRVARGRIADEMDLVRLIKLHRTNSFVSELVLREHQRSLV